MSRSCPYCGNQQFEEEDGLLVCTSCGRQQEGGLQTADDDADFGTQGKLNRRKIERKKVKVTKIYRGARAYKLYLQAWQHIVWRQCHALIHGSTRAPPELWIVARDLWTLKLSTLLHRSDDQDKVTSDEDEMVTADNEASSTIDPSHLPERPKTNLNPRLWDTVSLVHLAALLIRHPLSLSKIYQLLRSEELPFIRALRFVPYEITSHLPSEYQLALDTITIPQPHELQNATLQYVQTFSSSFGMEIPALNWRVLLYEWIVELGLPLDIYNVVKSLSKLLDLNFAYQLATEADPDLVPKSKKRKPRRTPIATPEFQLISLLVIATKLLFPFPVPNSTNLTRFDPSTSLHPVRLTDLTLHWQIWLDAQNSHATTLSSSAKHIETTDKDVAAMSSEEMDAYISWYQSTFVTPNEILKQKKTDLEMSILDMFPTPDLPSKQDPTTPRTTTQSDTAKSDKTNRCTRIQASALKYDSAPKNLVYHIFPSVDILKSTDALFQANPDSTTGNVDASNPILHFHELAAQVACTDLKSLVRAIRYTEGKLEAFIDRKHKETPMEGGEMDVGGDEQGR